MLGLFQGVKLIFTGGHISLMVAFKGPNVILGLYKCNYTLTRGKELGAATRLKQGALCLLLVGYCVIILPLISNTFCFQ